MSDGALKVPRLLHRLPCTIDRPKAGSYPAGPKIGLCRIIFGHGLPLYAPDQCSLALRPSGFPMFLQTHLIGHVGRPLAIQIVSPPVGVDSPSFRWDGFAGFAGQTKKGAPAGALIS